MGAGRSVFCGAFPGFLPLGATQRPALRSPDFPRRPWPSRRSARLPERL